MGLGVLGGAPRADVIAHLDTCAGCRALVDDMAAVGDSLLTMAPRIEPPPGFAARVLARPAAGPRPAGRLRRPARAAALGMTAAAAAAAIAVGVAVGFGGQGHSAFHVSRPAAVAALGGRQLSAAPLTDHGQGRGQVFVYSGRPSWVFMTVDVGGPPRQLICQVETKDGATVTLGRFTVADGYGSWGSTLTVDPATVDTVRLLDAGGQATAVATLSS
jgi:hypothetical protein